MIYNNDELVGILLPVRGRHDFLVKSLRSLADSEGSECLDLVIVVDEDEKAYEILLEFFLAETPFGGFSIYKMEERCFSVASFRYAFEKCEDDLFIWLANSLLYEKDWFVKTVQTFLETFNDRIGVLSIGGKLNKANFGMSSKRFVEYNQGEWFSDAYKMNFCDDELACRAILLGRFKFLQNSGVLFQKNIVEDDLLYDGLDEKIQMKKFDKRRFYKRLDMNFGLPDEIIYKWNGFRDMNMPLKGEL